METTTRGDEANLARRAYDLTSDLGKPNRGVYWTDLAASTLIAYGGLFLAIRSTNLAVEILAGALSVLALYRAVSFIHELTHLRARDVPGFKLAWNVLIGVPFLVPSLMYEGVHNLHHAKDRYGTGRDPEYLPLARYSPGRLAGFGAMSLLAPIGMVVRFGVMTPLSLLAPRFRPWVTSRLSALTINPTFQREDLQLSRRPAWLAQEIACWLWCWSLVAGIVAGLVSVHAIVVAAIVLSIVTFVNQLRTMVAHHWDSDGERMSFTEQFLDSVNVPPPALLPALWAPIGLRYHALHHLLPRLPYHNLGEAHRRLAQVFAHGSSYRLVEKRSLAAALDDLVRRGRERSAG